MSFNAKDYENESKFERPPALEAGVYPARLVQIVDVGLQAQRDFKGEAKPPKDELYVTYESSDMFLLDEEGKEDPTKPRWLGENFRMYSLDSDLATSTKRYTALDPTMEHNGYWPKLLGTPCMLTIVCNAGKGKNAGIIYNNIEGVSAMRSKEAEKLPELVNPTKLFSVGEPNLEVFLSLSKYLQGICTSNLNYEGSDLEKMLQDYRKNGAADGGSPKEETPPKNSPDKAPEEDGGDW